MRESNFNSPTQNRACVCITSALYDRRAIDAPSPSLPLVNSLTHLSYLTATSPRIREILSLDGGLERLVRILKRCATSSSTQDHAIDETLSQLKGHGKNFKKGPRKSPFKAFAAYGPSSSSSLSSSDVSLLPPTVTQPPPSTYAKHLLYTYTLAFQCIVNIGVRGSEMIRTRVVEAGALDVVVHVLEKYLDKINREHDKLHREQRRVTTAVTVKEEVEGVIIKRVATPEAVGADDAESGEEELMREAGSSSTSVVRVRSASKAGESDRPERALTEVVDAGEVAMEVDGEITRDESVAGESSPSSSASTGVEVEGGLQYRDEDVLLSLQLLAYLSKYPHVRSVFHSPSNAWSDPSPSPSPSPSYDDMDVSAEDSFSSTSKTPSSKMASSSSPALSSNVFSLVESFTHRPANHDRSTPRHSHEVQYWAGVIMRNACRKDESQGGIRQCANMACGVWEKSPREFAKCRRCRKAKYCSKACQSKAWQFGHRYWCAKASGERASAGASGGAQQQVSASTEVVGEGGGGDAQARRSGASRSHRHHDRHEGHSHHHHHHHAHDEGHGHHLPHPLPNRDAAPSRASANESNDDDEDALLDGALPPPAGRLRPSHPHRHSTGMDEFDAVAIGGVGLRVGEGGLDENEVAQEMMGGGVFGERVNTRPGVGIE